MVGQIERPGQVTARRQCFVVADVPTNHHLAETSRNLGAVERDRRIVGLYLRLARYRELSNTDQNEEDKRAREYEDEECFTNASIVPEAEEQCLVEPFS